MPRNSSYLFCIIFVSCPVLAEGIQELEPVIVSAPIHKQAAETVHPVNILAGDDLARKQSTTIGETLKGELGIHSMGWLR